MGAMGLPPSPTESPRWNFEARGPFTFGTCLVCGFRTPARRARYSAEMDLKAHDLLCESAAELQEEAVGDALEAPES